MYIQNTAPVYQQIPYIVYPQYQVQNAPNNPAVIPKNADFGLYNENTEQDLLKNQKYVELMTFQDAYNHTNNAYYVNKYTSNASFSELAQNKFFNTPYGFQKLTNIISNLEQKKLNALYTVSSPYYVSAVIPDVTRVYAGMDVGQCIENINKFFNSKFSDDLKTYILNDTNKLADLYFTSVNLGHLNPDNPDIEDLNSSRYMMM